MYQYAVQKTSNHYPLNLQLKEHDNLWVIEIRYTWMLLGGNAVCWWRAGISDHAHELPAALIILLAAEVINLVKITTEKIRSDLFQSKACVSVGAVAAKGLWSQLRWWSVTARVALGWSDREISLATQKHDLQLFIAIESISWAGGSILLMC